MEKSKELLKSTIVIDAHLDLLSDMERKHRTGRKNVIKEDYLKTFQDGFVDVIFAAVFVDSKDLPEQGLRRALRQIAVLYEELEELTEDIVLVKSTEDILEAKERGKISILITMEGVEPLNEDVFLLRTFYDLGVRILGFCWARSNWAADGARFYGNDPGYGITQEGRKLLEYAEELGMLLDVSHMNFQSFWDLTKYTKRPFIATHSNVYQISKSPRNLTDEQLEIMKERNCVMGLNGVSMMLRYEDQDNAVLDDLIRHYFYLKEKNLLDLAGMGLDQFDRMKHNTENVTFDVMKTHEQMSEFVDRLFAHGFTEPEIKGILGENLMRLLKETIG